MMRGILFFRRYLAFFALNVAHLARCAAAIFARAAGDNVRFPPRPALDFPSSPLNTAIDFGLDLDFYSDSDSDSEHCDPRCDSHCVPHLRFSNDDSHSHAMLRTFLFLASSDGCTDGHHATRRTLQVALCNLQPPRQEGEPSSRFLPGSTGTSHRCDTNTTSSAERLEHRGEVHRLRCQAGNRSQM